MQRSAILRRSFKQERPFADRDAWSRMVRNARARIVVSELPLSPGRGFGERSAADVLDAGVMGPRVRSRVNPRPGPLGFRDGVVRHYPGYQQDDSVFPHSAVGRLRAELRADFVGLEPRSHSIWRGPLRFGR